VRKRLFRGFLFTTPSCLRFPRVFSKPVLTNHRVFDMETHIRLPLSAQAKLLHGHAFLDDLQSLDPGLYKNLIFVKHYDGDVEDLCLTFAGAKKPTFLTPFSHYRKRSLLPRQAWDSQTQRAAQQNICGWVVDEEMVRKRHFCAILY
jgi:hypothetical protein